MSLSGNLVTLSSNSPSVFYRLPPSLQLKDTSHSMPISCYFLWSHILIPYISLCTHLPECSFSNRRIFSPPAHKLPALSYPRITIKVKPKHSASERLGPRRPAKVALQFLFQLPGCSFREFSSASFTQHAPHPLLFCCKNTLLFPFSLKQA